MARKRVLILGGGPSGVVAANNIVRRLKGTMWRFYWWIRRGTMCFSRPALGYAWTEGA